MKLQKYFAELVGTFVLASVVAISIMTHPPVPGQVLAGLTLGLFVYMVGGISGGYLNPAVTVAMASVKKISVKDAVLYIIFQLIAGFLALYFTRWFIGGTTGVEKFPTDMVVWKTALAEAIGAAMLVFGVSAVVEKKVKEDMHGIVIGGSLLLGIMLTGAVSYGILNPAVAVGVGVPYTAYVYFVAPLVGGVLSAWGARWLFKK
ncbi:aquaporin [Candidatus Peregrinibacteria bacterium]|nr:aquaporin [Candidatus Peregrinibacteria bacterium]